MEEDDKILEVFGQRIHEEHSDIPKKVEYNSSLSLINSRNKVILQTPGLKREIFMGMIYYSPLYFLVSSSMSIRAKVDFLIPSMSLVYILMIISKPLLLKNRKSLYFLEKQNFKLILNQIEIPWKYSTYLGSFFIIFEFIRFGSINYLILITTLARNSLICFIGALLISKHLVRKINFQGDNIDLPWYTNSFWKVGMIPIAYVFVIIGVLAIINTAMISMLNQNLINLPNYITFLILRGTDFVTIIVLIYISLKKSTINYHSILKQNPSLYQLLTQDYDGDIENSISLDDNLVNLNNDDLIREWLKTVERYEIPVSMFITDFHKFSLQETISDNIKFHLSLFQVSNLKIQELLLDIQLKLPPINLNYKLGGQNSIYINNLALLLAFHIRPKVVFIQNLGSIQSKADQELISKLLMERSKNGFFTYFS